MTDYRATPENWAAVEDWASMTTYGTHSCILELRARIEALEAGQRHDHVADLLRPNHPAKPDSSLVKRVHSCIVGEPECGHMQARAVIREVAAWLREEGYPSSPSRLEREAER